MSQAPFLNLSARLDLADVTEQIRHLRQEVGRVVVGQDDVLEQMLVAMVARGHCLLIGVPGLAKTMMARALSDALDMQFARVQFTPDLMPSDITGTNILDEDPDTGQRAFRFTSGPVFTNILLADEINRTPPKTQAALLEAMQERIVTVAGEPRPLPEPFFVLATQNPLEQEGTYPLPEAQLDRFMFAVRVTYPTHAEENRIVDTTTGQVHTRLERVLTAGQVLMLQKLVRETVAAPALVRYAVALTRATRPTDPTAPDFIRRHVDTGAGPRAGQYLVLAAKSRAVLRGATTPEPQDIRAAAAAVLRHRIFTNFTALSENVSSDDLVARLLEAVPAPDGPDAARPIVHAPPAVAPDAADVELTADLDDIALIRRMGRLTERIRAEVRQVIIGQQSVVDLVLTALLAGGHCLLVGVPGLAKTTLVKTIAQVLELDFKRIQFTPDLMPSDITGTDILEVDEAAGTRRFRFIAGPVFTNLLLADEINRTPPKTQAALLEAMQELAVTAGGTTYPLDPPFFVLATQNPLEQEGTYPLPEAQLDRFMFHIDMDYPDADEETVIVDRTTSPHERKPATVLDGAGIRRLQQLVRSVPLSPHVLTYVTTLVRASRPETKGCPGRIQRFVHCGAGPRASQYLVLAAKARAVMHGRVNVAIADVKAVAIPVMRHRIFTNFSADAEGVSAIDLVEMLLEAVPEPRISDEKALAHQDAAPDERRTARPGAAPVSATTPEAPPPEPRERPAPAAEVAGDTEHAQEARPAPASDGDRIVLSCPRCATVLQVPRKAAGQNARCRHCNEVFAVVV